MTELFPVTCPFCGLYCDDLRLVTDGGHLSSVSPECPWAEAGIRSLRIETVVESRLLRTAGNWLRTARQPLFLLSGEIDLAAVRAILQLGRRLSAVIDVGSGTGGILSLAMKNAGFLSGTLGELRAVKQVVLCGVESEQVPPRFWEVLGENLRRKAISLPVGDPIKTICNLRLSSHESGEVSDPSMREAACAIAAADSGLAIFGEELMKAGAQVVLELLLWLKGLRKGKHWYGLHLAGTANDLGVTEALLSETGYPSTVRLGPQGDSFSPRVWQAEEMLNRGEADIVLLFGEPRNIPENLARCKTILFSSTSPDWKPDIYLPIARPGVDGEGYMLRLDGVPVSLKPIVASKRPALTGLLQTLLLEVTQ